MKKLMILFLFLSFVACKKDQGPIEPQDNTVEVRFSADIQPIFNQSCVACHPNDGSLNLTASNAYGDLVGVAASAYAPSIRVVVGDAEHSVLYKKIDGSNIYGSNMPLGSSLSSAQIELIKKWIDQGAKNN